MIRLRCDLMCGQREGPRYGETEAPRVAGGDAMRSHFRKEYVVSFKVKNNLSVQFHPSVFSQGKRHPYTFTQMHTVAVLTVTMSRHDPHVHQLVQRVAHSRHQIQLNRVLITFHHCDQNTW